AVTLNSDTNTQLYQGVVAWRGNSLVESIEGYFRESEQLATRLWLSVDNRSAAGLLLQMLPGPEKAPYGLEQEITDVQWRHLVSETEQVTQHDLLQLGCEDLLRKLYPQKDVR